ncbi:T9SS type A sorting domain-containing protein, partial [Actinomycetota bacterium]
AMIPLQAINAVNSVIFLGEGGIHKVSCGSKNHSIKYNVQDGESHTYQLDKNFPYPPPGWNSSSSFYRVEFENAKGEIYSKELEPIGCYASGVDPPYYTVGWCNDSNASVYDFCSCTDHDIVWIKFYYTGDKKTCEDDVAVKTRPSDMTCSNVWINEANNFEFIFFYEYANNNWVKIYDMAGTEVFSIDMPYGAAYFEAALHDGMYTVKTFHEAGHILQEFIIGKP